MGGPKGSQQVEEQTPPHANGSGEPVDTREAASPQDIVLVAAYSSDDEDHGHAHAHAQEPPTPPICEAQQAFPKPPVGGCSGEQAKHATNGINSGRQRSPDAVAVVVASAAAAAAAAHQDHLPTPGASPSSASQSASAAGVAKEGEEGGDRCAKRAEDEPATPGSDDGRVSVLCRFRRAMDKEGER
eukprot:g6550.t1